MRSRIHRGAHEVGGSCIELEHDGKRLVLDLGRPLSAPASTTPELPDVRGLDGTSDDLLGVVLSHPHPDHYGLATAIHPRVPIYLGEAATRILREASFFTPMAAQFQPAAFLRHRVPLRIGPFTITPRLNDHSAFDAYSMSIEAGGRHLFYTGDIRGHGRKAALFDELLRSPPCSVHALLMEGTHIRSDSTGAERGPTEDGVVAACVETFTATDGMVLAAYSPQNIDRLVTIYKATVRSGRTLVMDLYTAAIAAATGRDSIPQWWWDRVRVYLPRAQKARVVAARAFDRTEAVREARIFPEELRARRSELVMTFRGSMSRELEAAGCLDGACVVWSMWPGYLRDAANIPSGIPLRVHHASGHAFVPDLQRLVSALAPERVVPIHSFAGGRFAEFFPHVEPHPDGEWWEV